MEREKSADQRKGGLRVIRNLRSGRDGARLLLEARKRVDNERGTIWNIMEEERNKMCCDWWDERCLVGRGQTRGPFQKRI